MRDWQWLAPLLVLAACRKPAPPGSDAGSPVAVREPVAPIVTVAPDKLEIIATSTGISEPRLKVLGGHVWVSTYEDDGLAAGEGPLEQGHCPLDGPIFRAGGAGNAGIDVVGTYPRLFALWASRGITRLSRPATAWVRTSDGAWKETQKLGLSFYPKLFAAFGDGAIIVDSAADRNSNTGFSKALYDRKNAGTWAKRIAPDGSATDTPLLLPPDFVAWHGATAGETLALVGTTKSDAGTLLGIDVIRIVTPAEAQHTILTDSEQKGRGMLDTRVRFHEGRTLVIPAEARTLHFIEQSGVSSQVRVPAPTVDAGPGECRVVDADFGGDAIYLLRSCDPLFLRRPKDVLRLHRDGSAERFELPSLNGAPCWPIAFALRQPDDLWVTARCGPDFDHGVNAVLRRGHAQKALEMK